MKSYTSIEQSKKLAEFLPFETADMYWLNRHIDLTETKYEVFVIDKSDKHIDFFKSYAVAVDNNEIIPCWSLAALFNVLPKYIGDYSKCLYYDMGHYYCGYMYDGDFMLTIEEAMAVNSVDACYEMILKLHEMELL